MVLGVSQAVPGMPLGLAVAGFGAQSKCLAAEGARLLVVTEPAMEPADVVERCGLARLVAYGPVQAQRLLRVPERVGVAALAFGENAESMVDIGLAEAVAEPPVQREAVREWTRA